MSIKEELRKQAKEFKKKFLLEHPEMIPFSKFYRTLTKESKDKARTMLKSEIVMIGSIEYINGNISLESMGIIIKKHQYVQNVIDVLHVLVKYYRYLSSVISIRDNIAYIHDTEVIYDTKKQRAVFNGKDAMFYLRDLIIANEPELKYNNVVLGD